MRRSLRGDVIAYTRAREHRAEKTASAMSHIKYWLCAIFRFVIVAAVKMLVRKATPGMTLLSLYLKFFGSLKKVFIHHP